MIPVGVKVFETHCRHEAFVKIGAVVLVIQTRFSL